MRLQPFHPFNPNPLLPLNKLECDVVCFDLKHFFYTYFFYTLHLHALACTIQTPKTGTITLATARTAHLQTIQIYQ